MTLLFQKGNFGGNFIPFLEVSKLLITNYFVNITIQWKLLIGCLFYTSSQSKKLLFVEKDAGSYQGPYVFLRARMVYTCSASFVLDDRSLIELIGMQQNRNNNTKYTVKFFSLVSRRFRWWYFAACLLNYKHV